MYGDKLKIQVEKTIFFIYLFLMFLLFYPKNGESSPIVDIIILNPIGYYKFYFGCTFFLGGLLHNICHRPYHSPSRTLQRPFYDL